MDNLLNPNLVSAVNESILNDIDWRIPVGVLCRADDLSDEDKSKHIAVLGLSVRAYNVLTRMNVHTIAELLPLSIQEMISAKNMGRTSVWNVIICIYQFRHREETFLLHIPAIPPIEVGGTAITSANTRQVQIQYAADLGANAPIAELLQADAPFCIHTLDWSMPLVLLCCPDISPEAYRRVPIQCMDLTVRSFNGLTKSKCQTVEDVLYLTIGQLMTIQHMGIWSVWDILKSLHRFCYSWVIEPELSFEPQVEIQESEYIAAPPPSVETVLKQLFETRQTTSLTIREAVEVVASQCRIKEAKARLAVIQSPTCIVFAENVLYTGQGDVFNVIRHSQFRDFRSLFVGALISFASERNADILFDRYGFNGDPSTLQELAEMYELTRERVRQIAMNVIKRLTEQERLWQFLRSPFDTVLSAGGNVCRVSALARSIREQFSEIWGGLSAEGYVELIADVDVNLVREKKNRGEVIYRPPVTPYVIKYLIERAKTLLDSEGEPVAEATMQQHMVEWYTEILPDGIPPTMNTTESLYLDDALQQIDGAWILAEWRWAAPHTKIDQIYVVLRDNGSPMHYEAIAERYREGFGEITPKQIHAGLGTKPDIFVLTGPGTYGLAEWGLSKVRWIGDIILDFLATSGKPMTEEEIRQAVWKEREASAASILLELSLPQNNGGLFHKFGSKWGLTRWLTDGTVTEEDEQEKGRNLLQRLAGQRTDARDISQEENKLRRLLAQARASVRT